VLQLKKHKDANIRLQLIYNKIIELNKQFKPQHVAIEAPFFGKNVQSMLKLGRAQGVAIAAAMQMGLSAVEYSPKKIKQSITGNGNASKEQVAAMLKTLLKFSETPEFLDATDGLAVAVCHSFQKISSTSSKKNYSGWDAFANGPQNTFLYNHLELTVVALLYNRRRMFIEQIRIAIHFARSIDIHLVNKVVQLRYRNVDFLLASADANTS
jgi:crossover junction endodeoxyribonuclease RuvC